MPSMPREIAKFLSGVAFSESIGHLWLGIWGQDMLPWRFSWFTFTSTTNSVAMILWPMALLGLVWFGWFRKHTVELGSPAR